MGAVPGRQTLRTICKMSIPNGKLWNKDLDPIDPQRYDKPAPELVAA